MMDKITIPRLQQMKRAGQKIAALTSYDRTTAQLLDASGLEILLVGDSLGMVKLGYRTTLPVTIEDMLYHTKIVARAPHRALLVADMPFMSYQANADEAVRN